MFKSIPADYNFIEMEKKWLKHWDEKGVVDKYLNKNNKSDKYFSFLDGPITANNPMGVHHAWGRTYKDLWPKFFNLLGYKQHFQNGFDCQGLWIEVEVEKELGLKGKKEIENLIPGDKKHSIAKFVELCKQRVLKFSKIQTEQSKRLGYFADWEHSYYTMSDHNNYMIWHFLKVCYENGWIYKGRESVPWCPRCETAISEHEILTENYKVVGHESIYLLLPLLNRVKEYLLIWTTTPWTIPANIAVAVDVKLDYSLVKTDKGDVWLAKDSIKRVLKSDDPQVIKSVRGKELVGIKYTSPFDDLPAVVKVAKENPKTFHMVIPSDERILPISTEEGTGLVHTAVSAGTEDFKLGKKLGLPMIPVIADNADYLPGLGFLSGKNAKKNPRLILDCLEKKGLAFEIFNYKHRYPACWRCKAELVWKVEDEWYIAMDRPSCKASAGKSNKTLRQRMLKVAKTIKWMPEFGLERELDWLKNMHDWMISKKNRYWGLALPIYECKKCGNFEVIGSREELKQRAIKGWKSFNGHSPHKPFIDEVMIKCKDCGSEVKRINDVGNVWLDAGIVGYSTISENNQGEPLYLKNKKEWKKWFPVDFITESFPGQFKNWFYAMIAESTVLENNTQFKAVQGYGTLLGEDGRPMHKSWGNSIEFNEGADKIGADVMRWMFSRHNPADNMLFGYKKADEVRRQFYLILWNIYKFFTEYAILDKFVPGNPQGSQAQNILDRWILSKFSQLVLFIEKSLRNYNAKDAASEVEKFVNELSTWYIRRSRDRVWVNSEDRADKQNFYQTLYYTLFNLSIVISPFMPYISEEIYSNLIGNESVHLAKWPEVNRFWTGYNPEKFSKEQNDIIEEMELVRKVVESGHAKRKEVKQKVRIPLAKLEINIENDCSKVRNEIWDLVLQELNVKNIVVNKKIKYPKKEVKITEEQLRHEGELRGLLRTIQGKRKEMGLEPTDEVSLVVPKEFKNDSVFLKRKVLAKKIEFGEVLSVNIL
ncbi:isoleucine--tRNA ligase [Candidatus Roizmanbacteria bacterium RIFCSPLOWO2_01_FULL_35_13]|uniref:Isoleucine--tRNA ligase n=1 Tax=Candidatus Roizmanbacteria bacterium RIFCSPLOWO2_01_FULL_35_13 TaxID=1802055 RepID=A0A1F7IHD5_9BACT|nr:MAG: isoleucine--tRNA ligase [Candidatus Roizmanbacteria bacterium RIFCSPLOWO2_01_FULL_35_13]